MTFESEIIVNPKFKKYQLLRDIVLALFVVVFVPLNYMGSSRSNRESLSEDAFEHPIFLYYLCGVAILYLAHRLIHYFTRKFEMVGSMIVGEDRIEVIHHPGARKVNYVVSELKQVVIIRGSTFHKIDANEFEDPYQGNNRIELHTDTGDVIKHEFLIKNEDHNLRFEKMILRIRKEWRSKILYKSN